MNYGQGDTLEGREGDVVMYLVSNKWDPRSKDPKPSDLIRVVSGESITFGKSESSSIVLPEEGISRLHATITHDFANNEIIFKDQSTRGSKVNGNSVHKSTVVLHDGYEVGIGSFKWYLQLPADVETLIESAKGAGKVRNSAVEKAGKASKEDKKADESAEKKGGILRTPVAKLMNMFSPRRSSSTMATTVVDQGISSEDMVGRSPAGANSPSISKEGPSFSDDLERELQHNAKREPSAKVINISTQKTNQSGFTSGSISLKPTREESTGPGTGPGAALAVSSNKKIHELYSNALEAHSNKDVPTLENLSTDTIHSVIKCAADASEAFHNDLNTVMDKTSGVANQFTEASALFEAVSQGKGLPFATSRILKERVRYCAQLEARLNDHKVIYNNLLESREKMASELERVRISCGVARSIVAEYQNLYDSVYKRISADIPRPSLDHATPASLKMHRVVLSQEEVRELTRALDIKADELGEEMENIDKIKDYSDEEHGTN